MKTQITTVLVILTATTAAMLSGSALAGPTEKRPLSDWVGSDTRIVFNWVTEGGVGLVAIISRDDLNTSQPNFDSDTISLTGKLREKAQNDGSSKIFAILHYEFLPLEVWTLDEDGILGVRVLDDGMMSADLEVRATLPVAGGAIDIRSLNITHMTFTGRGMAVGTGEGEFANGQQISVHITQEVILNPATDNPNSALVDTAPAENITLH